MKLELFVKMNCTVSSQQHVLENKWCNFSPITDSLVIELFVVCLSNVITVLLTLHCFVAFSALTLLVGWQEGHLVCKIRGVGVGVVICLERGADLHIAQLMPLPLTVSCFSKIQIGFTFLVPAHPGAHLGSPGQRHS